jgi:hypothetical protein
MVSPAIYFAIKHHKYLQNDNYLKKASFENPAGWRDLNDFAFPEPGLSV